MITKIMINIRPVSDLPRLCLSHKERLWHHGPVKHRPVSVSLTKPMKQPRNLTSDTSDCLDDTMEVRRVCILSSGLLVVALLTQRLPVRSVPEELLDLLGAE
jgi:hypothetical protein